VARGVVPRSLLKQRCNLAMALLAGIGYRGFVVPNSKLGVGAALQKQFHQGLVPAHTGGHQRSAPAVIGGIHTCASIEQQFGDVVSGKLRCNSERCTSAATARIDVSAPVEERLDEFSLSLPHRDEERGFSFRGHVVHGHTGLQVPENGGTPAVVQRVLHVGVGVLLGTGGRKASGDPPN